MLTGELVSVREYLATSYRPDCDYVDGEILERNVGETDHSRLQRILIVHFWNHRHDWGVHVFPETRVQVKSTRFRVPDVCVVRGAEPTDPILTEPPFICIEILSRDDRMSQMQERVRDYLDFGVPNVWLLDPRVRKAYQCTAAGMFVVEELRAEGSEVVVPLEVLFD